MSSLETLEARRLLSADGTWTITGTDAGESITIDLRASDNRLRAIVNGEVVSTRLLRGLKLLEVISNGGNDTIRIDLHDANPGLGIWVNAGPGRDRIFGGAGDENLGGGSGRDVIDGGRGNDIVRGGTDRDDVAGGDGNDYVQGNAGNDTLSGGWGDDRITGGTGVDQLRGGAGDDRLAGGKDADVIKGGAGDDRLEAGGGIGNQVYRQLSIDQTVTGTSDVLMDDENADNESLARLQSDAALKQWLIDRAVAQWQSSFGQDASSIYWANGGGTVLVAYSNSSLDSLVSTNAPQTVDASQTNTQEAGVDEADIVETDGNYLYILRNDELIIADADPAANLKIVSRTKLDSYASGIYLDGDRVTVLSDTGGYVYYRGGGLGLPVQLIDIASNDIISPPEYQKPQVEVTVFDVTDRANPSKVSTTKLDGSLADSRVIDGRLYLVVQNYLTAPTPKTTKTGDKEFYESEASYRARLEAGGVNEMIPGYTTDAAGAANGSLINAPNVYVHGVDRLDTTTVALINLRDPAPAPISTTAVIGANGQVYASQDNLYLAGYGTGWHLTGNNTELFKFGLGMEQVSLEASGTVEGAIPNRFGMDEEGEFFRVVTTQALINKQSSGVSVLDQIGDDLSVVGQVKDLGIDESLFSARFIGDRGYLTTFRQVDPLFTIDLSEPTAPKLAGELTIPGFSNYLQPIGEDYLLGLGQAADETGRATNLELSLFNVSDPAKPTRVATYDFDARWSIATYDPHAFAYFAEQGMLAIPINDGKLAVLHVDLAKGFTSLGTIDHGAASAAQRAVRIGSDLFSVGTDDVRAFALDDLNDPLAVLNLSE
jgi:uncharacterized secreted protein with C-terminal beta-propeller domain